MRAMLGAGAVLALGLALAPPPAAAEDLEPINVPDSYCGLVAGAVGDKPARKLSKEPAYKSAKPLYLKLELGSGEEGCILGALDESKGTGAGYDTIYLDANNNGDLTDDPKVAALSVGGNPQLISLQTPGIKLTVKYQGAQPRELRASLQIYGFKPRAAAGNISWTVHGSLLQALQGRVDIGGQQVLIRLVDGTWPAPANGCFNDFGADRLRIDHNGDGKIDPRTEDGPLSRIFAYGGKLWELSLDAAGRNVAVKPSAAPAGQVKLAFGLAEGATVTGGRLALASKSGVCLTLDPCAKEPARLPADTYQLGAGSLQLTDKAGGKWSCELKGSKDIVVAADASVELKLGSPVRVEPEMAGALQPGGGGQVTHRVIGACGETYSNIFPDKGRPPAPQVNISDASGGPVTSGKMEYG